MYCDRHAAQAWFVWIDCCKCSTSPSLHWTLVGVSIIHTLMAPRNLNVHGKCSHLSFSGWKKKTEIDVSRENKNFRSNFYHAEMLISMLLEALSLLWFCGWIYESRFCMPWFYKESLKSSEIPFPDIPMNPLGEFIQIVVHNSFLEILSSSPENEISV